MRRGFCLSIIIPVKPTIFLDRDGVIIENRANYVRSWDEVEIYPQALAALAVPGLKSYKVIIVTNQSPIGRGLLTHKQVDRINLRLASEIEAAGGKVDAVYVCPHHPNAGCECRKPRPGMLLQAAQDHEIDLARSIMIGDALSDLQAGLAAGVGKVALVRTGRGAEQENSSEAAKMSPFLVFDDLSQALFTLIG